MADRLQSDIKKAVLEALEARYGIITNACHDAGIARSTFYEWQANDPEFKAAVDEIQESASDFVESKLFEKINGVQIGEMDDEGELKVYDVPPSDTAITFYLRTKARKRGYAERTELTGADGKDLNYTVTLDLGNTKNTINAIPGEEAGSTDKPAQ